MAEPLPKPVIWMGDSLEVLRHFPSSVEDEIGFALYRAQVGGKHRRRQTVELDLVRARLKLAEDLHRQREMQ